MNVKTKKLLTAYIKKIVKEEVKNVVNEVLAETFIKTLTENKRSGMLVENIIEPEVQIAKPKQNAVDLEKQRRDFRVQAMKKLGITDQTQFDTIYGDVDMTTHGHVDPKRGFIDDDEDGIDLSKFGLKQ